MAGRTSFHVAAIVAASLLMSGCQTLEQLFGRIEVAAPQVGRIVSEVGAFTQKLCGFEPIAATILNLITGGAASGPLEFAELICGAVKQQALAADFRPGKKVPVTVVVRGIRVVGILTPKKGR